MSDSRSGTGVEDDRLAALIASERRRFEESHPRSLAWHGQRAGSLFGSVPMTWMREWPEGCPIVAAEAKGTRLVDIDGNEYVDFCVGDTGATAGHAPDATVAAVAEQAARGLTLMLPTDDGPAVADILVERYGLPSWQFTLSATDANRNALRYARGLTGRPFVLAFDQTYHGSVDDTLVWLDGGAVKPWPMNFGHPTDPRYTTRLAQFNDLEAVERALADEQVACVITEPVLTGSGIVLPDPDFHSELRRLTRACGTLLLIDETHTLCTGVGGYTGMAGLEPDMITMGKVFAGGVPIGMLGIESDLVERSLALIGDAPSALAGIGGTLAGNALSLAAARATLERVLTAEAFERMDALAEDLTGRLRATIERFGLPWHAAHLGCRVEYAFRPIPSRNNAEAFAARDRVLEGFMHLHALNRGILVVPFHSLAQVSAAASQADVERYAEVFDEALEQLCASS